MLTALLTGAAFVAGLTGAWSPCGFSMVSTLGEHACGRAATVAACAAFVPGAVVGGVATFGTLAAIGSLLGGGDAALVAAAAIAGVAALAEAAGMRIAPRIRRQVPEHWRRTWPLPLAAAGYGVLLGLGFTTFVLTFAVPVLAGVALAVGDVGAGVLIGIGFAAGRALPVVALAPFAQRPLGLRATELMAERPAILRGFRAADALALAACAVALGAETAEATMRDAGRRAPATATPTPETPTAHPRPATMRDAGRRTPATATPTRETTTAHPRPAACSGPPSAKRKLGVASTCSSTHATNAHARAASTATPTRDTTGADGRFGATAAATRAWRNRASDPSAAGDDLAFMRPGGRAVLRTGGIETPLPADRVAIGGAVLAVIVGGEVRVAVRATSEQILTIEAPRADAVAVSDEWVAIRRRLGGGGAVIEAAALTGRALRTVARAREPERPRSPLRTVARTREPERPRSPLRTVARTREPEQPGPTLRTVARARESAQLGRPALDGDRVVFHVAGRRTSRIDEVDLATGRRRVLRRGGMRRLLTNPSLAGGRLLYVETTPYHQALVLGPRIARRGRTLLRIAPTIEADKGYSTPHGPHRPGASRPRRPPKEGPPGTATTLWTTALGADAAYVTRLRTRDGRTRPALLRIALTPTGQGATRH